jgi:hypothetical protein
MKHSRQKKPGRDKKTKQVVAKQPKKSITAISGMHQEHIKPKIPYGALPGNIELQVFCSFCHIPKYYYLDRERTCVQCGQDFIFSAKEQKFWYETLKFNFNSEAIRCMTCRKSKRTENSLQNQLSLSHKNYKTHPNDPYAMLAVVEALCLYHERFNKGKLSEAITLSRKALKVDTKCYEGLYWEGIAQKLSYHQDRANALFEKFIEKANHIARCKNLVRKAKVALNLEA